MAHRSARIVETVVLVMMMSDADLYRLASWSSWVACAALVIAAVALAIFFAGPGEPFGSINDLAFAATLIALVPAVLAVDRLAGPHLSPVIVRVLTIGTIAGIVLSATGSLLLVARVITLEDSYITGGLGILPVIAWMILVAVLSLGSKVLPPSAGWLAVSTVAVIVATIAIAVVTSGPVLWVAGVGLAVVVALWLAALASGFAGMAPKLAVQ